MSEQNRLYKINKVKPGMILGSMIEDRLGRHLIESGTVLTEYYIEQLESYGIRSILIQLGDGKEKKKEVVLSEEAKKAVNRFRIPDPPSVKIEETVKKRITHGVELMYSHPDTKILKSVSEVIADDLINVIESNDAVAINVNDLKSADEDRFQHSVDVATIGIIMAKKLRYSKTKIRDIGIAGILHDIGKTKLPAEILNKQENLTEEEEKIMRNHAFYGYEIISSNRSIKASIADAVLQHHELGDGTGYPQNLKADQISPYAKIITVANIYDGLFTNRSAMQRVSPRQAVEILMAMSGQVDITVLQAFLNSMILYPVDSIVMLSNGDVAKVVRRIPGFITRPMVVSVTSGKVYDLSSKNYQNIVIVD